MAKSDGVNLQYNIDYRSKVDDAWYSCRVVLEDREKLRVKFKGLLHRYDEVYSISDFSNRHEVEEFLGRYRPLTGLIEENECSRVIEGMTVCATLKGNDGSLRYFDAIVDAVQYKQHIAGKCQCTCLLFWQHGPEKGNITKSNSKLADVRLIIPGAVDSIVYDFAKLVMEKLNGAWAWASASSQSSLFSKRSILPRSNQGSHFARTGDHDRDLGGVKETSSHHHIILENLEKDLSPSLMMEFIHEQTSITTRAYVSPTFSAETYARGAILLDCRTKLKRIYDFITNPNHFIVSSSGRPWVIAEDALRTGTFNTNLQSLEPMFESDNKNPGSKLTIARIGTEEYAQAQRLKVVYMEFRNHVNGLVTRLDTEEKKIRDPSGAN